MIQFGTFSAHPSMNAASTIPKLMTTSGPAFRLSGQIAAQIWCDAAAAATHTSARAGIRAIWRTNARSMPSESSSAGVAGACWRTGAALLIGD